MNTIREAPFDKIASQYDMLWSDTPVGTAQRSAVWTRIDRLFHEGDSVLDLGCGTGVDAVHFKSRGVSVYGIDSSPRMVEIARSRGIHADCWPIERLQYFDMRLDGVVSNFGALNCVASLTSIAVALGRSVRQGGHLALCCINAVCPWEIGFYLLHCNPGSAFRRLPRHAKSSIGAPVFYHSSAAIVSAFRNDFELLKISGIGLFVPPSYVTSLTDRQIQRLAAFDARLADKPVLHSLADHCLYIFKRR